MGHAASSIAVLQRERGYSDFCLGPAWRLALSLPQVRAAVTLAAVSAAAGSTAFMPAKVAAFIHVSTYGIWLGEHTRAFEQASKLGISADSLMNPNHSTFWQPHQLCLRSIVSVIPAFWARAHHYGAVGGRRS